MLLADARPTFGSHRVGVLAALLYAVSLVIIDLGIFWEAVRRLRTHPSRFLSALIGSVGPFIVSCSLAYCLLRDACIGTEARATFLMRLTKLAVYGVASLFTPENEAVGLSLGTVIVLGSFVGKRIVDQLSKRLFMLPVEATLVVAGLRFLTRGLTRQAAAPRDIKKEHQRAESIAAPRHRL